MQIADFNVTSSATANGIDKNTASGKVMNNGQYVSNAAVSFNVTGSSLFQNGQNSSSVTTNNLGEFSVDFVDSVVETVIIQAYLTDEPSTTVNKTSSFSQGSSAAVDTIALLVNVDGAKADGKDQNIVELQTMKGVNPVAEVPVSVSVTNGALFFINDSNHGKVVTDDHGRATLEFTNTKPGDVTFKAFLDDNISVNSSIDTNFVSATPDVQIELDVTTDGSQANGQALNRVQAIVKDAESGAVVANADVSFSVTGSALFIDEQNTFKTTTDADGIAYASFKDTVVESVSVTANAYEKSASASSHFSANYAQVKIGRIYNAVKDFPAKGPTTAWSGAEIFITATEGSGHYQWSVVQGGNQLSVTSTQDGYATLTFGALGFGHGTYTVRVTDTESGLTADYSFNIFAFFYDYGRWGKGTDVSQCPSVQQWQALVGEWGGMIHYPGWVSLSEGSVYWTNLKEFEYTIAIEINTAFIIRRGTDNYFGFSRVSS